MTEEVLCLKYLRSPDLTVVTWVWLKLGNTSISKGSTQRDL